VVLNSFEHPTLKITTSVTQKEIADICGTSEVTLRKFVEEIRDRIRG